MTLFDAALIVIIPVVASAYLCGVVKLGFIVLDKTEQTGFNAGFYLMTVIGGIALPIAIAKYVVNT